MRPDTLSDSELLTNSEVEQLRRRKNEIADYAQEAMQDLVRRMRERRGQA